MGFLARNTFPFSLNEPVAPRRGTTYLIRPGASRRWTMMWRLQVLGLPRQTVSLRIHPVGATGRHIAVSPLASTSASAETARRTTRCPQWFCLDIRFRQTLEGIDGNHAHGVDATCVGLRVLWGPSLSAERMAVTGAASTERAPVYQVAGK